jgi:hypothetical protein
MDSPTWEPIIQDSQDLVLELGKGKQGETNHDTLWLGLPKDRNNLEVFSSHWSPPSMQIIL